MALASERMRLLGRVKGTVTETAPYAVVLPWVGAVASPEGAVVAYAGRGGTVVLALD